MPVVCVHVKQGLVIIVCVHVQSASARVTERERVSDRERESE